MKSVAFIWNGGISISLEPSLHNPGFNLFGQEFIHVHNNGKKLNLFEKACTEE